MDTSQTYQVSFPVTHNDLTNIIETAASDYWLHAYALDWGQGPDSETLLVTAPRGDFGSFDIAAVYTRVNPSRVAAALGEMLAKRNKSAARWLAGDADGVTNDAILQFAIFGDVVYG